MNTILKLLSKTKKGFIKNGQVFYDSTNNDKIKKSICTKIRFANAVEEIFLVIFHFKVRNIDLLMIKRKAPKLKTT